MKQLVEAVPEFAAAISWVEAGLHEGFHLYQLLLLTMAASELPMNMRY